MTRTLRPHQELWKPVIGYEGIYEVSNLGRVRSLDRVVTQRNRHGTTNERRLKGDILTLTPDHGKCAYGRLTVKLSKDGKAKTRLVHQLCAESFIGPRPHSSQVAHNDGDPANNRIENLRYATALENTHDKFRHGTVLRGGDVGNSKLNESKVRKIKRMSGVTIQKIADEFDISIAHVSRIRSGSRWGHIQ